MKKPWTRTEVTRLVLVVGEAVKETGFLVTPNDKAMSSNGWALASLDFRPNGITPEDLKEKTIELCAFLKRVWRRPTDVVKQNGGYDPFEVRRPADEDDPMARMRAAVRRPRPRPVDVEAPPAAPEILREGRPFAPAAPAAARPAGNGGFRQAIVYGGHVFNQPAGGGGNGAGQLLANGAQIGLNGANVNIGVDPPVWHVQDDELVVQVGIDPPADEGGGRFVRAQELGAWPPDFLLEKPKKETLRFKYEFIRADGGVVYATIY